jgi:FAD/FMN-containing dehydrogenase
MTTTITSELAAGADPVAALAAQVTGRVLRPAEPGFAEEISPFNAATVHSPDVVVVAADAADVAAAVRWAVAHGLPVGVQATGHGAVTPVEGVLVSTTAMQDLWVDPVARTARIGAGVKWSSVLAEAAPHGLAPLIGSSSDVGAVGYTLGGGLPLLGRAFGFAADHVRSLEVVTADGSLRHVDADHFPDLFWGLRGSKGNLGIVTSMTVELVPVTELYGGGLFFPGELVPDLLPAWRDWSAGLPETTCTSLSFLRLPPFPDIREPLRGRFTVHVRFAHLGDEESGERLLAPMRRFAPALVDTLATMPYTALDRIHEDPTHPVPVYERSSMLPALDEATIDTLLAGVGPEADTTVVMCELRQLGGALGRPAPMADAISVRGDGFALFALGVLAPPIAQLVPGQVDALVRTLEPHSTGRTFVNLHGVPRDSADRARPWSSATYQRLRELKAAYDPSGLFRFGHAIG